MRLSSLLADLSFDTRQNITFAKSLNFSQKKELFTLVFRVGEYFL